MKYKLYSNSGRFLNNSDNKYNMTTVKLYSNNGRFLKESKQQTNGSTNTPDDCETVINEILAYLNQIVELWNNSDAYKVALQDSLEYKQSHFTNDLEEFLRLYQNRDVDISFLTNKEYDEEIAYLSCVKTYAATSGIYLDTLSELRVFANNIKEYLALETKKRAVQVDIIKNNKSLIYRNAERISIAKSQNREYSNLIGEPNNIKQKLGDDGFNLTIEDANALNYVINLEDEEKHLKDVLQSLKNDDEKTR